MMKPDVLNRQQTRYDIVYFDSEECDCIRSIFDYDGLYNIDRILGTYRFGEWIVVEIYDSPVLWHDNCVTGTQTYLVKTVKGVES